MMFSCWQDIFTLDKVLNKKVHFTFQNMVDNLTSNVDWYQRFALEVLSLTVRSAESFHF